MNEKRLQEIAGWHLAGHSRSDIIEMLEAEGEADAQDLLTAALQRIEAFVGAAGQDAQWHLAARRELYRKNLEIADYKAAHSVLVDMMRFVGADKAGEGLKPGEIVVNPHHMKQRDLAELLGISTQAIQKWNKNVPPPPRNKDRSYSLPAVWSYWQDRRAAANDSDEALLAMMDPEDKARLLKARADNEEIKRDRARIELDKEQAGVLTHEQVNAMHEGFLQALTNAGQILQREYGGDALDVLNDAIEECARLAEQAEHAGSDST